MSSDCKLVLITPPSGSAHSCDAAGKQALNSRNAQVVTTEAMHCAMPSLHVSGIGNIATVHVYTVWSWQEGRGSLSKFTG